MTDPFYIITRLSNSIFSGPVKPTPGTADFYATTHQFIQPPPNDAEYYRYAPIINNFENNSYYVGVKPTEPPISIYIKNIASSQEKGTEDSITLVGINPGDLQDQGANPDFSNSRPLGRSLPYSMYQGGSSRTIAVTLPLHRDMIISYFNYYIDTYETIGSRRMYYSEKSPKINRKYYDTRNVKIDSINSNQEYSILYNNIINWFRSLSYPIYKKGGVISPRVYLKVGKFLSIKGSPSVSITYNNVYSDGYPVMVTVNLSVVENLMNSPDQNSIKENYNEYVKW